MKKRIFKFTELSPSAKIKAVKDRKLRYDGATGFKVKGALKYIKTLLIVENNSNKFNKDGLLIGGFLIGDTTRLKKLKIFSELDND